MNLRVLLSAYGVLSVIGGVLWIAMPGPLIGFFGASSAGPVAAFLATMFGAAAIGVGVMAWMARGAEASPARNALVLGLTLTNLLWFGLLVRGALSGEFNHWAWFPVSAYALWTLLFVMVGRGSMKRVVAAGAG